MANHFSAEELRKYADVIVNFALGGGQGIKKGDVVRVTANEYAKPLYIAVCEAVWGAGGNVVDNFMPNEADRYGNLNSFYAAKRTDEQLDFFPAKFFKGQIDDIDHNVFIDSETDPNALSKVDASQIMRRKRARKPYMEWRDEKELAGKFTWVIVQYPTPALAEVAGMSVEDYTREIAKSVYLNESDPVAKWGEIDSAVRENISKLNALNIESVHMTGDEVDLKIKIGEGRKWEGGGGRNIPSFEIFTSPDWRGTEGWIKFNRPLLHNGVIIEGVRLEFESGRVAKATAEKNEDALKAMIATPGADAVGEFSLTDKRLSPIDKFMANTLFDENTGGEFGNTHIALGKSFKEVYTGDQETADWDALGFNDSAEHADIVSTVDRTVTATLKDGSQKVIYQNGQFQL